MRVILLNTRFAGSGIEITCATDVILVHSMGDDSTQAVGRANRVGRTTPLHVHKLLYPHEAQQSLEPLFIFVIMSSCDRITMHL